MTSWGRLSDEAKLAMARAETALIAASEAVLNETTLEAADTKQPTLALCMSEFEAFGARCPVSAPLGCPGRCWRAQVRAGAVLCAQEAVRMARM